MVYLSVLYTCLGDRMEDERRRGVRGAQVVESDSSRATSSNVADAHMRALRAHSCAFVRDRDSSRNALRWRPRRHVACWSLLRQFCARVCYLTRNSIVFLL